MLVFALEFLSSEAKVPFWEVVPAIVDGRAAERELAGTRGPWRDYQKTFEVETPDGDRFEFKAQDVQEARKLAELEARQRRGQIAMKGALIAFTPPIALLALGLVVSWIVSGFRKSSQ
ncbi:MAG: hypothetical protein EOS26_10325 [Mesorhizobium sp.]|nr:MAG: hypothetical protein EOS26_10325 [Mesorhizobium sp.]